MKDETALTSVDAPKTASVTLELGFAIDVVEKQEAEGRWPDLTRLEAKRPDILAGIVWFLARDVAVRTICEALSVSPCTVNRVRHDPKWRDAVVSKSKGVVEKIDELLMLTVDDALDKARNGKLPGAFDVKLLFDIRQLLSGGATQRTEVRVTGEEEEFMRFMTLAKQQALPEGSEMVLGAEILGQGAARDVTPAEAPVIPAEIVRDGDSESPDKEA